MTPPEPHAQSAGTPARHVGDAASTLDVRLLGPLELRVDGRPLALPGGKPKALLAVLLVSRNRVVSSDSLADAIWDGDVPGTFLSTMQVHVSTLRRALRPKDLRQRIEALTQSIDALVARLLKRLPRGLTRRRPIKARREANVVAVCGQRSFFAPLSDTS